MSRAKRYNKGKLRYELISPTLLKELAKVYTMGAEKYTDYDEEGNIVDDGADNWRKGQLWKGQISSIIRHLEKFRDGEDFDMDWPKELLDKYGPTYHIANAAWGIGCLLEYYKTHPELDNRNHAYLNPKKIGLDIDEVLAQWTPAWCKCWHIPEPSSWFFDRNIMQRFKEMEETQILDEFYLSLEVLTKPEDIPFEPYCYVTSRPVKSEISEQWLDANGFPHRPVYTVETGKSKVEIIKSLNLDIFVDDRFDNFVELNKAGICCYLFDAPHNQRYDVGYKRIKSLKDII